MQIDGEHRPYSRTGLALPGGRIPLSKLEPCLIIKAVHSAVGQDGDADPTKNPDFLQSQVAILSAKRRPPVVHFCSKSGGFQVFSMYAADDDDVPHVKPEDVPYHLSVKRYDDHEYQRILGFSKPVDVTDI